VAILEKEIYAIGLEPHCVTAPNRLSPVSSMRELKFCLLA